MNVRLMGQYPRYRPALLQRYPPFVTFLFRIKGIAMSRMYFPSPEDSLLMEKPFRYFRGAKIDTRWSGGWLTPVGKYHSVDYANGVTHATLAEEFGSRIGGSGSITSRPPVMRLFDTAEWVRITYLEYSSFCVEYKGTLVSDASQSGVNASELQEFQTRRQTALLSFVREYSRFDEYYLNDARYTCFKAFRRAICYDQPIPLSNVTKAVLDVAHGG